EHRNLWKRLNGASEVDGSTSSDEKQLIGSSDSVNEVDDEKSVLLNGFMRKLLLQADSLSNNLESRDEEPLMALYDGLREGSCTKLGVTYIVKAQEFLGRTGLASADKKASRATAEDFISRTEIFVRYLVSEDVPKDVVKEEREIEMQKEDLLTKPENIRKRLEESALLGQPFTKNDKLKDFG
ncbi:hypothetical protein BHE74_00048955, partial [Ensete ventricosum]